MGWIQGIFNETGHPNQSLTSITLELLERLFRSRTPIYNLSSGHGAFPQRESAYNQHEKTVGHPSLMLINGLHRAEAVGKVDMKRRSMEWIKVPQLSWSSKSKPISSVTPKLLEALIYFRTP